MPTSIIFTVNGCILRASQPLIEQEYHGPINDSDREDIIYLNMMEGYNLPFEVRGYFMPEQGDPVIKHVTAEKLSKPAKQR
jgi:hypothetical protein